MIGRSTYTARRNLALALLAVGTVAAYRAWLYYERRWARKRAVNEAEEILRQGALTEFWKLLVAGIDKSIAHLESERDSEDMSDLPAERYKVEDLILKAKIKKSEISGKKLNF